MKFNSLYMQQVDLLLDVLPILNQFECFALKGGTAINLFIRNMPRLSVDIDLTYLPIEPRDLFLKNITTEMLKLKQLIQDKNFKVQELRTQVQQLSKLVIFRHQTAIKIEPNLVIRGSVFGCKEYDLCQRAQDQFLKFTTVKTLSSADIYGGKICAALDRQHPRDLFDIKHLFSNEGISDEIRQAFIVYLCSGNRPIHEMLNSESKLISFKDEFNNQFHGMTDAPISNDELINIREQLVHVILKDLTHNEKQFLLSVKSGEPDWSLMKISGIDKLPALQWKILNIKKMDKIKRQFLFDKLQHIFEE